MKAAIPYWIIAPTLSLVVAACGDGKKDGDAGADAGDAGDGDGGADTDTGDAGPPPDPGAEFDEICAGQEWDDNLVPGKAGELTGEYVGGHNPFEADAVDLMKVVPEHPFHVTHIRVAFASGEGPVRIRLTETLGRSYPNMDTPANLVPPQEFEVTDPDPEVWYELDVSNAGAYLKPTEHYAIVYEHLDTAPFLAAEAVPEGERSRALILRPSSTYPYGSESNFRMELKGNYFCAWDPADHWFAEDAEQPFVDDGTQRVAVTDLDGDGHEDLVFNAGGPLAYLGDGAGGFAAPGFDPFVEAPDATMLVFGDLDNDGDADAFAAHYVNVDGDGDGVTVADGDCDDTVAEVNPDAEEVADNGLDDDCDGTADDGSDTSDADEDGVTIADGDCNDTRDTVYPDAPELLDARDNDCDGEVDEEFANTVLLNDGTGLLSRVAGSGVEVFDPSAAAALGDGNADGLLDVYWGNWYVTYPTKPAVDDVYATGNGDGTFTESTVASGMVLTGGAEPCYGVKWVDYNNDGWPDVWVGDYGGYDNLLWHNNGDGTFMEQGEYLGLNAPGGTTFGGDFGDIDNDGDLDHYAANICHPRYYPQSKPSPMLVNLGSGSGYRYDDRTAELGLIWDEGDVNAAFADFDHDMDLDLAVASLYGGHYSRLYRNDGAAGFTDVTYHSATAVEDSVSLVWVDHDEDGDLDLLYVDRSGAPRVHLFENLVGQDQGWLQLVLEGTTTNRDGVGARVTVTAGGVTQIRETQGGGGHSNVQGTRVVHFGLADADSVDELTVRWIGGNTETFTGASPNGRFRLVEGSGAAAAVP